MAGRVVVLAMTWLIASAAVAAAGMATARVTEVDSLGQMPVVLVDTGRAGGLASGAEITLLRELDPIVHPLTGEVLGVPQEPVGIARVTELEEDWAAAQLVRVYSSPLPGDVAEFARAESTAAAAGATEQPSVHTPAVAEVLARVRELEDDVTRNRQQQQQFSDYPVFAREVWDKLHDMHSYLVSMDERLLQLESQQGEDRDLLELMAKGEYQAEETRQFTIRYDADTRVQLRVAGKTLIIDVERDSLHVEELRDDGAMDAPVALDTSLSAQSDEGEAHKWLGLPTTYVQAGSLGVIALLAVALFLLMRRRQRSAMDDLEDFDAEYEEEEEF